MSTPLPDPPRNTHWAKGLPNGQGIHGWLKSVRDRVEQVASDSGTSELAPTSTPGVLKIVPKG